MAENNLAHSVADGKGVHPNTHHGHCVGGKLSDEYKTWRGMLQRCYTVTNSGFKNYGAKGVTVCDRWRQSFEAFIEDMGARPSQSHTIDRIDGTRGYEPGNCRWATMAEQGRNRKSNIKITWQGRTLTALEWSEITGVPRWTIARRFHRGWEPERIFSKSVLPPKPQTTKLDETRVREIRRRAAAGERISTLAKEYGVGRNNLYSIVNGETWRSLK